MDGIEAFNALLERFEALVGENYRLARDVETQRQRAEKAESDGRLLKRENESLARMERFVEREDIAPLFDEFLHPKPAPDADIPF